MKKFRIVPASRVLCSALPLAIIAGGVLAMTQVTNAAVAIQRLSQRGLGGASVEADNNSQQPQISKDATKVVFSTRARNLNASLIQAGGYQIYVHTVATGANSFQTGTGNFDGANQEDGFNGDCLRSSYWGNAITWYCNADNPVGGFELCPDGNNKDDVYKGGSLFSETTTGPCGTLGDDDSQNPSISHDGTWIAFETKAELLHDGTNLRRHIVARKADASGNPFRISETSSGIVLGGGVEGDSNSFAPACTTDTTLNRPIIAFSSDADNLTTDGNDAVRDVFVSIPGRLQIGIGTFLNTTTTALVSRASGASGAAGNGTSDNPAISEGGRYIAFESTATNLASGTSNGKRQIYLRDRTNNTTERVSVSAGGTAANDDCTSPAISPDGRYVAFVSRAGNLVPGVNNGFIQVYVKDTVGGGIFVYSTNVANPVNSQLANLDCANPAITVSGGQVHVVFDTAATNLVTGTAGRRHVFLAKDSTPSSNDTCANASNIGDGRWLFDNAGADTDGPSENASCSFGASGQIANDVWFRYTAPKTGIARLSTCFVSNLDTRLAAYPSCPSGSGTVLACVDNSAGCNNQGRTTFNVVNGQQYIIRVGVTPGGATGLSSFVITTCRADLATLSGDPAPDGILSASDVVAFFTGFFNQQPISDLTDQSGNGAPDGLWTASDVVAFFDAFFAGCYTPVI